jgi:lipoprotein LpqH
MIGVVAAAIVIAALAGCSTNKSSTSSSSGASAASSATASGTPSPQQNRVLVDGQDQGAVEHVRCYPLNDGTGIKIGLGNHGVEVLLSSTDPPGVQMVHFSNILVGGVEAGMGLAYEPGKNEGNAEATKQGNTYKITGTATSSNATNPGSKSFEIDVACP